ncbi:EboA domain-containing protein [Solimicrobium silvestre]|uniref:Uncharacterized protein n=1 Tax=Solimicrobium silvestre TaxID=2099400 RepID=A0A2S9H0F6_9BURK|nr:EboA domain-containing protein [Solimicrobium silvestre]PRC93430.1 hypothetical protein S2091_1817 [Solimicrobium silvestre]
MNSHIEHSEINRINRSLDWLSTTLHQQLDDAANAWFVSQLAQLHNEANEAKLFKALGLAARYVGKSSLLFNEQEAAKLRRGFDPTYWSVDQAVRVAFLLTSFVHQPDEFSARLNRIADSAEINELIALYRGFALYPASAELEPRAREAIRSSMRPIFEAMAHRNPYPADIFDQAAWNQMIVKCFFMDSALWPIQGLEQRANPELARILVDLAHERWAAGRAINPELWRCVAPHADSTGLAALDRVMSSGSEPERIAVYWSLCDATSPQTKELQVLHQRCIQQDLSEKALAFQWNTLNPAQLETL